MTCHDPAHERISEPFAFRSKWYVARVHRGMVQIAWRFLVFQKDSALSQWFRFRTENARRTRKTMIVVLARKLLIALWRFTRTGELPEGVVLRASA
jgi:transposase